MQSVVYAECSRFIYCYAECRHAECRYAECSRAQFIEFYQMSGWIQVCYFLTRSCRYAFAALIMRPSTPYSDSWEQKRLFYQDHWLKNFQTI